MAQLYDFSYTSLDGVTHSVTIDDPDHVGSSTTITGYLEIVAGSVDTPLECIKGTGLKIYLDANDNLNFSNLFSDNERKFEVEYTRGSTVMFTGFLNPEGLYEDYVSDKWVISLDVSDGLSFLKNLSYVDNSTGLFFTGKQSELTIIKNCLLRTGLTLNINTSIGISYTNQDASTNVLAETFLNADRFRKEDNGNTVMNCDEVLRSVLEKYNACITMYQNEWYIYRPIELFNDAEPTFYRYDSTGAALSPTTKDVDFAITIGSAIDGYSPHWANANQRKTYKNAYGGYRINYKYGFVKSFLDNIFLEYVGGAYDDWTINDATYLTVPASNQGAEFSCLDDGTTLAMTSDVVTLTAGDTIRFLTKFTTELESDCSYAVFRVKLDDGAGTIYNLQEDGSWGNPGVQKLRLFNGQANPGATGTEQTQVGTGAEIEYVINSDGLPANGDVSIEIYPGGIFDTGADNNGSVLISEISLEPTSDQSNSIKGENHTFERVANPSSKVPATKEIFNGDNVTDLYLGTIYQDDETTPTETWKRDGVTETKVILEIMGRDTLNLFASPAVIWRGDVYGFFNYLSLVQVNNNTGKFMPVEYSYNIKTNIVVLKLYQIYGTRLTTDIEYTLQYDYGNVVQPTIKG